LPSLNFKQKQMRYLFLLVAATVIFSACESESGKTNYRAMNPNLRQVEVTEIIQTPSYTYLNLKEEGDAYWAAISRRDDIVDGGTYYFDNFMEMKNFQSKELDKTFESIYFIEEFSDAPFPPAGMVQQQSSGSNVVGDMEIENIEPVEGGITISELLSNKGKYEGKTIKIRGKVVKYTDMVMGKNWIHIQDGTRSGDDYDLTVTSTGTCDVGDIVTVEGNIILDQDFGYGYVYDVILENGVILESVEATSLQ